jgi:hypothetical protein
LAGTAYAVVDLHERVRGVEDVDVGMGVDSTAACEAMVDRLEGRARGYRRSYVSTFLRVPLDAMQLLGPEPRGSR